MDRLSIVSIRNETELYRLVLHFAPPFFLTWPLTGHGALAMLQRDALVFVQERLLGREQATRQYGPYGTNLATEP